MATFHRKGGNFGPEWVATFKRNAGNFAPDYAISTTTTISSRACNICYPYRSGSDETVIAVILPVLVKNKHLHATFVSPYFIIAIEEEPCWRPDHVEDMFLGVAQAKTKRQLTTGTVGPPFVVEISPIEVPDFDEYLVLEHELQTIVLEGIIHRLLYNVNFGRG
jgi:hypothetical protein